MKVNHFLYGVLCEEPQQICRQQQIMAGNSGNAIITGLDREGKPHLQVELSASDIKQIVKLYPALDAINSS